MDRATPGIVPGLAVTRDQRLAWDLGPKHPRHGCVISTVRKYNKPNMANNTMQIDTFGCSHCKCVEAEFIIKLNKSRVLETVLLPFS